MKVNLPQLIVLLEDEAFNDAAHRILTGEDPVRVLNDQRPFVSRYNDDVSRARIAMFQDICAGRLEVTR